MARASKRNLARSFYAVASMPTPKRSRVSCTEAYLPIIERAPPPITVVGVQYSLIEITQLSDGRLNSRVMSAVEAEQFCAAKARAQRFRAAATSEIAP